MKIPQKLLPGAKSSKDRQGVALLTVLTVMALTTILVLTFFSLATSEHRASSTYSHGLQAQQVAEQAVNMVIAQIREATTVDTKKLWTSQPGAIRVFEDSADTGVLYKLYSDDNMVDASGMEASRDFSDLADWDDRPEHFVDLNEPVIRGEKVYYPIVNPSAADFPRWPKALNGKTEGVEGFSYTVGDVPGGDFGNEAAGIAKASGGHLAMPARWLYQTEDGSIGVLNDGMEFLPMYGGQNASETNRIVARFAFWADDETSKLNLNTHAGGLAWDIPKAGGELDMNMGKFQPAQKEWQRYPGHPATTHLIPALAPGVIDIVNDRDAMEMLFKIVPRVVGGGSESGTRLINTRDPKEANGLDPDTEPLFPSVDDMVMRSDRTPHEFPDSSGAPLPPSELSEYLERAKFFLTTSSRAPEVNPLNLPKIAMWPIYNRERGDPEYSRYLTAFDQLIHYCSIVGANGNEDFDFIFRREQADSATHDYDSIQRNQQLLSYLEWILKQRVPGYGQSFQQKYGSEQVSQTLALIFDYIRSSNLHDDTIYGENFEQAFVENNTDNHSTFTNPRDRVEPGFGHKGHGQVTPIQIGDVKGLGRFYSLASAGVHVAAVAENAVERRTAGGGPMFAYPGLSSYRNQNNEDPSGEAFSNLPPMPSGIDRNEQSTWPDWLRALPPEESAAAFDPASWNWQLMFLSPSLDLANNLPRWRGQKFSDPLRNDAGYRADYMAPSTVLRLQPGERLLQASVVFNLFSPSIGWSSINPDIEIHITRGGGFSFTSDAGGDGQFLAFTSQVARPSGIGNDTFVWATNWSKPMRTSGARAWGGLLSFGYATTARQHNQNGGANARKNVWWHLHRDGVSPNFIQCRYSALDRGYDGIAAALGKVNRDIGGNAGVIAQSYRYDLVTAPFKVTDSVDFSGGTLQFEIFDGGPRCEASASDDGGAPDLVQDITLNFPSFSLPAPFMPQPRKGHIDEFKRLGRDSIPVFNLASLTADPANDVSSPKYSAAAKRGGAGNPAGRMTELTRTWDAGDTFIRGGSNDLPGDIVRAVGVPHGDMRLTAVKRVIGPGDTEFFDTHHKYNSSDPMAHSFTNSVGVAISGFDPRNQETEERLIITGLPTRGNAGPYRNMIPMPFFTERSEDVQFFGDFDNGAGTMIDGPYINKPDEGNVHALKTKFTQVVTDYWEDRRNYGEFPYFSNPELAESGGPSYFSPNRILSGPGMFGSLPTGIASGAAWQTLLFRPNVIGGRYRSHPGAGLRGGGTSDPPDHLLLDLFWMPVVEPYAISEPLSTAGKINLNYQMIPFLHVKRATALSGVFRSEYMLCIPNQWNGDYKHDRGRGRGYHWRDAPTRGVLQGKKLRSVIFEDDTIAQFEERFQNGNDVFRTASELCEIHLIPQEISDRLGTAIGSVGSYTPSLEQMENGTYWSDHALVGDNSRERPYTNIHQRVTTKSNTFKVHYRAQVLKQSRRDDAGSYATWQPLIDSVQAEFRGSSIVERYVDPNDPEMNQDIARLAANPGGRDPAEYLSSFYQYRVVNPRRFAP